MIFAHPVQLCWGLLAIVLVVFTYARRAVPRREPVAAGGIWAEVLAQDRVRSAWLRWRREASLIVELAILALIVLALAEPLRAPPRRVVAVLDNSSDATGDETAPARLAAAKREVAQWIAELRDCDGMAIVSAGDPAMLRCPMTGQRRMLDAALEAIEPVPGPARSDFALDLARRSLGDASAGRIIVVGGDDHGGAADADFQSPGAPIWPWLAGMAAALAALEWCLYQRRWTD